MRTFRSRSRRHPRSRACASLAICAAATCAQPLLAATPSSWVSPVSGSWIDGSRWSTNPLFPNNGTPPGATYDATIGAAGAAYEVLFDATALSGGQVTVDSLTVASPDARLRVAAGSLNSVGLIDVGPGTFSVEGPATISASHARVNGGGTMHLVADLNATTLTVAGASGIATFTLNGQVAANRIDLGPGGHFDQMALSFPGQLLFDNFHQTGGLARYSQFWVGVQERGETYRIGAGSFEVNAGMYVGRGNDGTFVQTGGNVRVSALLNLGVFDGTGRYELSGGSLESFTQVVGDRSPATFTQTGGTNVGNVTLGREDHGSGTYSLSGGELHVPAALRIGERGIGRFVQTGGLVRIDNSNAEFALLIGAPGPGSYELSGGSLLVGTSTRGTVIGFGGTGGTRFDLSGNAVVLADHLTIGYAGAATFNQTGGTAAARLLQLGGEPGSAGRFVLSAGLLIPDTLSIGAGVVGGNGTFLQSGGTVAVTDVAALARTPQSRGHYDLSGGNLVAPVLTVAEAGPASFVQSGGAAAVGNLDINGSATAVGSYQLGGGALQVTGRLRIDGPGSMLFSAGRLNVATLELQDDARLLTTGSDKVIRARTLLAASSNWIIDLADNAMILDYDGGASPLELVRAAVSAAYADGAWTGGKLTSSTAAAMAGTPHPTGVGYAEAAELFGAFPASFEGEPIDSTAVLVKHTLYGDANLDGVVNLRDFNLLAANFGQTNRRWSQGDFTYGGAVTLADFNLLAANFGYQATGPTVTPQDWANLAAVAPEPALLGALVPLAVIARRRRRCRAPRR